ncbi:MAG: DNA mismatch repair protein MutS, partial [Bdellovibrionales bacterium]|nr:DNA mismatch repair protein MutS [Bdellovibrionales bacterium]
MSDTAKLTPLMQQFWEIKNQHLDKILFFRMGDFYEMFHDDAKIAAPILNIALTSRNKKSADDTPMCGIPYHSVAAPLGKLLAAGLKVAICDQLEDPDTAKGIVKRGVTRILSPGMVYDPETLSELSANFVAAFDNKTISFLDATTGECFYYETTTEKSDAISKKAIELLVLLQPSEIVLTKEQKESSEHLGKLTFYKSEFNDLEENWPERFQNAPVSAKRLLTYATRMQGVHVLSAMQEFTRRELGGNMSLGANTLKHLEVFQSYRGEDRGSLFYAINRTKTSAGARLLKSWLQFPLLSKEILNSRYERIEKWMGKPSELKILRQALGQMGDIERRLTKISYSNCHVRDLMSLMNSLQVGLQISPLIPELNENPHNKKVQQIEKIANQILKTLIDDLPLNMKSGGYIRTGVRADLDELISLSENGQKLLLELEAREKEATGISSLKVRYNNVFGYYIEVTNSHKDKVPDHYKRKQTLANAERYITQELDELERKILSSREKRVQLEELVLKELRDFILSQGTLILEVAQKWSELDVLSALSWLAMEQRYVRPRLSHQAVNGQNGDMNLYIEGSRHPVVEQEVKKTFVPNSISIRGGECLLLTGPNMAGKSTLMRQVAVTALMAQAGSFVPAKAADLPIFEQIFTRIGASDSLSEGLSTFMVEMKETAEMLQGAGERTLVVLDEVGRGTSTYDGMSLAQAILEYLVESAKSLTLFATHYHEITDLAKKHTQIHNAHMGVQEHGQDIQFLYTLKSGPANKSYGIQVAKLAGLPDTVVKRAAVLLREHEEQVHARADAGAFGRVGAQNQMDLFALPQGEIEPL